MSDSSFTLPAESPAILRFQGPDAVRFLNGQLTQDTALVTDQVLTSCVTDAKGKLQFFVELLKPEAPESLWVVCPRTGAEGLRDRLERYLIADDVEVEDLSGEWTRIHSHEPIESAAFSRKAQGPFGPGFDCWWPSGNTPDMKSLKPEDVEDQRVAAGLPAWGHELVEGLLPPEAGLDQSAISYHKGCYIGQEVISRIKSAGKLNRRLALFTVEGSPSEGQHLIHDGKPVGTLTSCRQPHALGFLKKTAFNAEEFVIGDADLRPTGSAQRTRWA